MAERERVTVLGTSPAYLQYLVDAGVTRNTRAPSRTSARSSRRARSSRAPAPLGEARPRDVPLQSISGGTDILGCFVMGSPWTRHLRGREQLRGWARARRLRAWSDGGPPREGNGELVCMRPFPSRPVGFLRDPDGARLRQAYYEQHSGVWTHGDLVDLTPRGTVRVLGRCDGMLNIRGIRIGPSEIYDVLSSAVPGGRPGDGRGRPTRPTIRAASASSSSS